MGTLAFWAIPASVAGAVIYLFGWAASEFIGYALRGRQNQQKWQSRGKYAVMAGTPILLVCAFHYAAQGSDDFHLERFSLVALRDPPKLARVVAKSSSSFGLHSGDSCAYSRIEVPRHDYLELLASIAADRRFTPGIRRYEEIVEGKRVIYEENKVLESELQAEVWNDAGYISEKTSYVRPVPEFVKHYSLIFLSDEKHIEVNSCI